MFIIRTTDHADPGSDTLLDTEISWHLSTEKPTGVQELVTCNSTNSKALEKLQHWCPWNKMWQLSAPLFYCASYSTSKLNLSNMPLYVIMSICYTYTTGTSKWRGKVKAMLAQANTEITVKLGTLQEVRILKASVFNSAQLEFHQLKTRFTWLDRGQQPGL